ncbi:hypothetical protein CsSME_00034560 [Camellia sinensis var. sinensis]
MLGHMLGRGKDRCSSVDRVRIEPGPESACLDILGRMSSWFCPAQNRTRLARLTMLPAKGVLRIDFILGSVISKKTLLRKVEVLLGLCQAKSTKVHDRIYVRITILILKYTGLFSRLCFQVVK